MGVGARVFGNDTVFAERSKGRGKMQKIEIVKVFEFRVM